MTQDLRQKNNIEPLVSIIIPTFNSGKVLATCLSSVIAQTYKNYEIVIQDGGSSDKTLSIAEGVKNHYDDCRISIFQEKDNGIYDAMNKAIFKATGEWLYFLGSDDKLYDAEVLANIFSDNDAYGNDVIYGNITSTIFKGIYGGEFDQDKILEDNISHQAIFYKRSVFDKVGLFNLKYKMYSDWDHNLKWFLSNQIKKKFKDIIVADYADGGYSAGQIDMIFEKDRVINYLSLRKSGLPFTTRLMYFKSCLKAALRTRDLACLIRTLAKTPSALFNA